jgi:hypothetical protein
MKSFWTVLFHPKKFQLGNNELSRAMNLNRFEKSAWELRFDLLWTKSMTEENI